MSNGAEAWPRSVAPADFRPRLSRMTIRGRVAPILLAALAVLLGGGSLLLFAIYLITGFRRTVELGLGPVQALAWDGALSLLFFLQHSSMVRPSVRARVRRVCGEHLVGVVYTVASGVTLLVCLVLWQPVGEPIVELTGAASWVLRLLSLLAVAGFFWGVGALGSFDTLGLQPVLDRFRRREAEPAPLAIRGPYRWVRHPLYLFSLVLFWAYPVVTADRLLFNLLWTCWVVVGTVLEERDLVSRYGEAYESYRRQVPMLLPWRPRPAR